MHALPMTTPSVVKNARTLLAQRASSATIQVSFRSIMIAAVDYNKPQENISPGVNIPFEFEITCHANRANMPGKLRDIPSTAAILYLFSTRFNASSTALLCGSSESESRYSSAASENLSLGLHRVFRAIPARMHAREDRN